MFASESVCQSVSPSFQTGSGVRHVCARTRDQRIEEREREKGTKRAGGGSEFPSVAGGKVREREGGHGPTAAAEEGLWPVVEGGPAAL